MNTYQASPPRAWSKTTAPRTSSSRRRRGIASLLSMLYLVIFAVLALGFYAQTNMAVQVSNNERRVKESLSAAEAGLQYIRYELSRVTIPMMPLPQPQLTDDQVFEEVWNDIKTSVEVDGSNLEDGDTVGDIVYDTTPADGIDPPYFEIPAKAGRYLRMTDKGPWFRVRLEQSERDLIITTVGKSATGNTTSAGRGVQVRFRTKEWPNNVFTYGMASPNAVNITVAKLMIGGPADQASILSTYTAGTPITIGNASSTVIEPTGIAGNITLMAGAPNPTYVGSHYSVGGVRVASTINSNIPRLTEAPEWPTPDVTVFSKYATTRYLGGIGYVDNCYIDPAFTPTVIFTNLHHIRGVLYIKKGASVTFSGGVRMQCVVVGEPSGSIATNIIRFEGNGVAKDPLSSLPADDTRFTELRELTGTFVLAPKWDVTFAGSFVSVAGSIVADKVTFTGNAPATITGTVVNLGNYPLTIAGSSALTFAKPVEEKHPGLRFTERFAPKKGSYKEVGADKYAKAS